MNHGGQRKGAGRKPAPDGTAKIAYGTKLDPGWHRDSEFCGC
jgi:hypothetical protein